MLAFDTPVVHHLAAIDTQKPIIIASIKPSESSALLYLIRTPFFGSCVIGPTSI